MQRIILTTVLFAAAALASAQEMDTIENAATYTFTSISDPHATEGTGASRINNVGDIVGSYSTSTEVVGFLDVDRTLTNINAPGALRTWLLGINNSSEIVGYYRTCNAACTPAFPDIAFIYRDGKYTIVHSPSKTLPFIQFIGINDAGTIVGSILTKSVSDDTAEAFASSIPTTREGFIYEGGKYTYLAPSGSPYTVATGISNSGEVVGYYLNPATRKAEGFSYSGGKYTSIVAPGAKDTYIYGISYATGEMVGIFDTTSGATKAFVYSKGVFTTVTYPGSEANSTSITGINDDGDVAGQYKNSKGIEEGFSAKP